MPRRKNLTAQTVRGPRRYLRYPEQFGITDEPDPADPKAPQQYQTVAALVQHELARQAIEQMVRLDLEHDAVAAQIGISAEQLRRQLRGESAMTLERMHQLARAVGLRIDIEIERTE